MKTRKLIKLFQLTEDRRRDIALDSNCRLNPEMHWVQLKAVDGKFPLADEIQFRTWLTQPRSLIRFAGFMANAYNPKVNGQHVTGIKYRLSDGTDDFYWDGSNWIHAGVGSWNTEEEVSEQISKFEPTDWKFQIVVNLKSNNPAFTPVVKSIRVLYDGRIEFQEDILYRSLVPTLRNHIRPISDFPFVLSSSTDQLDLKNEYKIKTPYNIVGVDSVFVESDDAELRNDIFNSFDRANLVIHLDQTVSSGKQVRVRFIYEPEVSVRTSSEYDELEKVPQLVIEDFSLVDATKAPIDEYVINKIDLKGYRIFAPLVGDFEVTLDLITDKQIDQMRLADEAKRFFANNPFLYSVGLDERYRLWLTDEYELIQRSELYAGRMRFKIMGVRFWSKDAVEVFGVKRFVMTDDIQGVIEA